MKIKYPKLHQYNLRFKHKTLFILNKISDSAQGTTRGHRKGRSIGNIGIVDPM